MKRNKKYNKEIPKETFMNGLRHIVLFITGALLFADPPEWVDDPGAYEFVATIAGGIILSDGVNMAEEGDLFGAFDEAGTVRGVAVQLVPGFGPYEGETLYEMTLRSNTAGDTLSFKYYDASEDAVLDIAETYEFVINDIIGSLVDPVEYNCGNCDDNTDNDYIDYALELHSGTNLVSFYALPVDNSLENVMFQLGDNVTGVITEGGASTQLSPGTWVGSLTEISPLKGYWIIVNTDGFLTVFDGVPTDPAIQYNLHFGANLISFPSSGSAYISYALPDYMESSISGIITEGGATTQMYPGNWIGSLTEFQGGNGYWFISDDDISFSYDLSTLSRTNIAYKEEKLDGYEYVQSTKQAFYFIESIEGINDGDYILSFNGDKLIGSRQWQGSIIDVPAMGSDGNSYSSAYIKAGDTPTFKLLSGGKLTTLEGDVPAWSDNGLFMVSSLSQVVIPESYSLRQAYPNPFNPTTTLSFAIPVDAAVSLSIYNLQGREVSTLIDANMDAGYHSIVWDANSYASGVYFVKMMAGEFVNTQKLMLIK